MATSPTTGFRFKRGDTVKNRAGLHGRVVELLPIDAEGSRFYRVRIECPSPKPIHLSVSEGDLELITRHAAKSVAKARTVRAIPRAFRNEAITSAELESLLAAAQKGPIARGVLRSKPSAIPCVG